MHIVPEISVNTKRNIEKSLNLDADLVFCVFSKTVPAVIPDLYYSFLLSGND